MGTETSPPSSVSTDAMDDHPHSPRLGLPERMLQKMGFYHNPVLIMIRLITFPLWLFILSAVNIVMPLHAAIIVSTFSLHSCFSSCLLITGRQPEKITPPRYLGQKHRNTATREASRESVDLTLE